VPEAAALWHRLPVAAALATSGLLPRIPLDLQTLAPGPAELMEEIRVNCGEGALTLLAGAPDTDAGIGRFDANAVRFAQMPAQQVDAIWRAARVVPEALLSADSRSRAARRLFDVRNRSELFGLRKQAPALTHAVDGVCRRLPVLYRTPAQALVRGRHPGVNAHGWQHLPAASAALAVLARLAARGIAGCAELERRWRPQWAVLAAAAPDIVTLDIVLAELSLAGAERADLFKEHP
jgi:hypothetical protein